MVCRKGSTDPVVFVQLEERLESVVDMWIQQARLAGMPQYNIGKELSTEVVTMVDPWQQDIQLPDVR
jgi:hypothetical protein